MAVKKTVQEPNIYRIIYTQQGSQKDIKLGDECNHGGKLFTVGRIRLLNEKATMLYSNPDKLAMAISLYAEKTDKLLRHIMLKDGDLLRIDYL